MPLRSCKAQKYGLDFGPCCPLGQMRLYRAQPVQSCPVAPYPSRYHTQCIVLPIGIAHMYTGAGADESTFSTNTVTRVATEVHVETFCSHHRRCCQCCFLHVPHLPRGPGVWLVYQEASVVPDVSYSPLGTCPFSTQEPGSQLLQECFYR